MYKMKPSNILDWIRYDFPIGIKNLRRWFKIIWSDRDYDPYFIYTVLHHKLSLMEHFIRHDGHHLYAKRDADQIKKCVLILNRLIEDDYHENAFKDHERKWGVPEMEWTPIDNGELSELHINYPNVKTEKDKETERKEFKRVCEHENILREQDLEILFGSMRKHIRGWWD